MDIKEIQVKKKLLEQDIDRLLERFYRVCQVGVEDIRINKHYGHTNGYPNNEIYYQTKVTAYI